MGDIGKELDFHLRYFLLDINVVLHLNHEEGQAQDFDLIVLPGGMPGVQALADHAPLAAKVREQAAAGRLFAAICAAPALALQGYGVLKQRRMTCYPAVSDRLSGCTFVDQPVVVDGNCITSQGPGTAIEFALELVRVLRGDEAARAVAGRMVLP